ncbi:dipeptide ABC transporter ATP-binding protein [Aurantimonas aggregata]|uniref:Glutathione import ATP-binding protein GsiA n=1 Tax=Aurantimonas aggregata TaxID=2047720 RepID=A0A6L9MNQ3_9HYPH|nr:ABC transporter ATP-binding protein [Aurantimonas aggregata]NDV89365.1 dipeptide ABC transporter ATP-binding protein [Aurantimonas aggregata]
MTSPILTVENLSVAFNVGDDRWREIVNGISFNLHEKETVAIVGESGSGKSVSALAAMRLLPEDSAKVSGSVRLADRELLTLDNEPMRRIRGNEIAMIFQEPMTSLNPVFTIGFQLVEAIRLHRTISRSDARAEARRLLEKVRISDADKRLNDYPHEFSGGMRQRVMIAMAIAGSPKVLIADEPTTALDVTIQAEILDLVRTLQDEEGLAVLFITHDMGVVAQIADRTLVMYQGNIVEQGSTDQIFRRAEHPYTRALLSAVPRLGESAGHDRPMRFPEVDVSTGKTDEPKEGSDTVDHNRTVLEVFDLTTRYPITSGIFNRVSSNVHAVEKVSFDLKAGETLALVGESGCGKSTTGRSILRLTRPTSGSIIVNGNDVATLGSRGLREARRDMQMIFQDPFASLNPRRSLGDAIKEPLYAHGLKKGSSDRVADLLVRVGLTPDMAKRYPHELSGGQRQRVCIARALALEPKLIVADEPVAALDASIKAKVVNLMLDLQESLQLAYLFISHDMGVVERISHRVAVMYLGEIVEIGPRRAVFANPQHPYTKRLLSAVPEADPSARGKQRNLSPNKELKSPFRAVDYQPPLRAYRTVSEGHRVQEWGSEWID